MIVANIDGTFGRDAAIASLPLLPALYFTSLPLQNFYLDRHMSIRYSDDAALGQLRNANIPETHEDISELKWYDPARV